MVKAKVKAILIEMSCVFQKSEGKAGIPRKSSLVDELLSEIYVRLSFYLWIVNDGWILKFYQ